jgi:hypothetical protein
VDKIIKRRAVPNDFIYTTEKEIDDKLKLIGDTAKRIQIDSYGRDKTKEERDIFNKINLLMKNPETNKREFNLITKLTESLRTIARR